MIKKIILLFPISLLGIHLSAGHVYAQSDLSGEGSVDFKAHKSEVKLIDPENPDQEVDPGPSPSTDGLLRLDFVFQLNFGKNKLSNIDKIYTANAQLFYSETEARGNYIQVTDDRATGTGWTLQVRQEQPFVSVDDPSDELKGAFISFDNAWANSTMEKEYTPTLQTDVIQLDKVGTTYDLATAGPDKGYGTWAIQFGASSENKAGQTETLEPLVDENGNAEIDPNYKKQIYKNSAVTFFVPGSAEKKSGKYQTVLTWIIGELP